MSLISTIGVGSFFHQVVSVSGLWPMLLSCNDSYHPKALWLSTKIVTNPFLYMIVELQDVPLAVIAA